MDFIHVHWRMSNLFHEKIRNEELRWKLDVYVSWFFDTGITQVTCPQLGQHTRFLPMA
jgi:hypothetical protein